MSLIAGGNLSGNRPGCWGKTDVFDNQSRDCRGCGFQSSCRDQIIKQTMANQPAVPNMSVPSYSTQFLTPTPFAVPQPQPIAPPPMFHPAAYAPPVPQPPQPPQPQQVPIQVMKFNSPTFPTAPAAPPQMFQQPRPPQPQPIQQQVGMGMQDFYGRVQDPLFFALMQPPPFRPQMEGETFMERFGKNLMLDLGAMACFHLGLALRQMFLPPQPSLPPEKVINGP